MRAVPLVQTETIQECIRRRVSAERRTSKQRIDRGECYKDDVRPILNGFKQCPGTVNFRLVNALECCDLFGPDQMCVSAFPVLLEVGRVSERSGEVKYSC